MDIREIHEKVFQFLIEKYEADNDVRFMLRSIDRYGRLENGYWFHGNDNAAYISFWNAWDAKSNAPNIYFQIDTTGMCKLILSESNNIQKISILKDLATAFKSNQSEGKRGEKKGELLNYWEKTYSSANNYISNLDNFLKLDRSIIDAFLRVHDKDNIYIPPIELTKFKRNLLKIERWRDKGKPEASNLSELLGNKLHIKLLHLQNIGSFKDLVIHIDKPITCIVGGNGSGKTTIFRALALGLVGITPLSEEEENEDESVNESLNYFLRIDSASEKGIQFAKEGRILVSYDFGQEDYFNEVLFRKSSQTNRIVIDDLTDIQNCFALNTQKTGLKALIIGFSQQTKGRKLKVNGLGRGLNKSPNISDLTSLIYDEPDGRFDEFKDWLIDLISPEKYPTQKERNTNRELVKTIFKVVSDITGDSIKLTNSIDAYISTKNNPKGLPIMLVSQGYRNVLGWVGFFMKRLYDYGQWISPKTNFKELPAVCLIDEIDTYLHLDWQYTVLEGLSNNFPNVQFFITSHSPFVLTSVPSDKIAILELNTEGGQIVINEKTENLYGADANRAADVISTKRKSNILAKFDEADNLIDENKLDEAQIILKEDLNGVDADLDLDILRAKRLIRTKLLLQKAKLEEAL